MVFFFIWQPILSKEHRLSLFSSIEIQETLIEARWGFDPRQYIEGLETNVSSPSFNENSAKRRRDIDLEKLDGLLMASMFIFYFFYFFLSILTRAYNGTRDANEFHALMRFTLHYRCFQSDPFTHRSYNYFKFYF